MVLEVQGRVLLKPGSAASVRLRMSGSLSVCFILPLFSILFPSLVVPFSCYSLLLLFPSLVIPFSSSSFSCIRRIIAAGQRDLARRSPTYDREGSLLNCIQKPPS